VRTAADREVLFLLLFANEGQELKPAVVRSCYYFFFELPYHCYNLVAFLLLLNW